MQALSNYINKQFFIKKILSAGSRAFDILMAVFNKSFIETDT